MNIKRVLIYIFVAISIILATLLIYFITPLNTKQNLKLPSSSSYEIIDFLNKKGYNVNILDRTFLKIFTNPRKGWLYINKRSLPRYKFLKQIGSYSNHYTPITIIPGETTYFILEDISKKLNLNLLKLQANYNILAKFKEGNFLADTYNIPIYFKESDTIRYLLDSTLKEYKKISLKYYNSFNQISWRKIITIASIIEKEAANKEEMPLVASVIFNRITKKMRLQMDGTLNYGKYSHIKVTHYRIKNDKSSYNTYKFKGVPKYPVCNVSKSSIIAAIKPKKTNYLYFMKNSNGVHDFTIEYKNHIKNIKKRKNDIKKGLN